MSIHQRSIQPAIVVSLLVLGLGATATPAAITDVTSADDVCPEDADPCVIKERVVVDRAILDFGDRTVRLEGKGGFNVASSLTIRCRRFDAMDEALGFQQKSRVARIGCFSDRVPAPQPFRDWSYRRHL